jgi:chromosome segregation ATPase
MASKFSDEERARIIAEANFYTGKGPKPPSLEPKPAPKPVRKEAGNLIYKTREVDTAAIDTEARNGAWNQWRDDAIARSEEALQEAIGEILAGERERERDAIKSAVDELDRELGKAIAVNQGKAEGRANAIENRLEREVREMQQRIDRAQKEMAEARLELLNLASEFRAILNDAAEAQRQISLALLHR